METEENKLFKWVVGILLGIMFTLIGVLYGFLRTTDANAQAQITDLQSQNIVSNERLQNLEANVYLLCVAQHINCVPPLK